MVHKPLGMGEGVGCAWWPGQLVWAQGVDMDGHLPHPILQPRYHVFFAAMPYCKLSARAALCLRRGLYVTGPVSPQQSNRIQKREFLLKSRFWQANRESYAEDAD